MGKIRQFFRDVKAEITKVAFPTVDDLKGSTIVVIVTVVIAATYLGAVDWGLSKFVEELLKR